MSENVEIAVLGIGAWSPQWMDWNSAASVLCGNVDNAVNASTRPSPAILPPTERRRAPESVLLGVEVALQACTMAGIAPADLPHVFASSYGELTINDYLCETLAKAPLEVSPIRFHNSVHNAPAGYWAIAAGCTRSSTAISAGDATFGAALLETALSVASNASPALLSVYDVPATGPLGDVVACSTTFGVGFVLGPDQQNAAARLRIRRAEDGTPTELAQAASVLHAVHRENPAARSLALLQAIARKEPGAICIAAGPRLMLDVEILPWAK
jgi:hypothetical protein